MHAVDLRGFHPHQPAFQVLDLNEDSHQATDWFILANDISVMAGEIGLGESDQKPE